MIQQFLTLEYGNKKKLREKLIGYYGDGNYEVVERSGNQWQIMVPRKLESVGSFLAIISEFNTDHEPLRLKSKTSKNT
ncbi:hypothetical protein H9L39_03907 [Fusarium oxysporum f. sp. albedinis]|nr:hypothetical protein H9L39_03907 [Fusarium oxysporum f. sp. albedinis]